MKIGYARVSTSDQKLDSQEDALWAAGCDKVFVDKITGKSRDRPQLNMALATLRTGDQLVVTRLNRLSRVRRDLYAITDSLRDREIDFQVLNTPIDTATLGGRIFFAVLAEVAEWELENLSEATKEGQAAAKRKGRHPGRPHKYSNQRLRDAFRLYDETNQNSQRDVSDLTDIPVSSLRSGWRRLGLIHGSTTNTKESA